MRVYCIYMRVYIHIYRCVYVYTLFLCNTCVYVHDRYMWMYMCTHMRAHSMCTCLCTRTGVGIGICKSHEHVYVCIYVYMVTRSAAPAPAPNSNGLGSRPPLLWCELWWGLIRNPPPPRGVGSGEWECPSLLLCGVGSLWSTPCWKPWWGRIRGPSRVGSPGGREASLVHQAIFCGRRFRSETLQCPFNSC